jgi:ABC-type amino acid transport substrate-binding protein
VLPLIEEQGYEVIPVDNHQIGVAMVKRGRTQAVVIPTLWVSRLGPDLEGLVGQPFTTLQGGLYVDQNQPELVDRMRVAIKDCNKD